MEEMTSTVKQNADDAAQAKQLAVTAAPPGRRRCRAAAPPRRRLGPLLRCSRLDQRL